jgi:asparagine synthase (glutamine-hydrolysing)
MCGIGGILRTDGRPIPEEWLDAIDARIAYRGPDGTGRFRDRVEFRDEKGEKRVVEVAFVHRRLSIIDHKDGAQPMVSERGRNDSEGLVAVVFNGCIYNHRELRAELESKGHQFVTDHSDTEVLLHGWREWGEELPDRLEGMYAFAVWDREARLLYLARDKFGEKSVYRAGWRFNRLQDFEPNDMFVFASSPVSIRDVSPHLRTVSEEAKSYWLPELLERGYTTIIVPALRTENAFEIIQRSARLVEGGTLEHVNAVYPIEIHSSPPDPREIEHRIDFAVSQRLEADVPLGCFLSGGVDSSLIAHFAKKHKPDLMTFSVRMPDRRYDESAHAEAVARHIGTNHRTLDVAMSPAEDLVHLIDILGQPIGDSSILPSYWVSKAAREHVKVALSGDGGDELFIGYERYMAAPFLARHWWWLRFLPASFLHRSHPKSKWNKLARLIDMARDYRALGIAAMESIFTQKQIQELLSVTPAKARIQRGDNTGQGLDSRLRGNDAIKALRAYDIDNYLPGDLLRKTDTASMAVALEVRCPYLDRDLARAVLAMPIEQLIPNGERKGLLKQIARKYLPREVVDRPKMGFAIPIGEWFRNDFGGMKTLLLDHLNSAEPFGPIQLNRKGVQKFIDEHMRGRRDHSHRLFTLLTLSIWAKQSATIESQRH